MKHCQTPSIQPSPTGWTMSLLTTVSIPHHVKMHCIHDGELDGSMSSLDTCHRPGNNCKGTITRTPQDTIQMIPEVQWHQNWLLCDTHNEKRRHKQGTDHTRAVPKFHETRAAEIRHFRSHRVVCDGLNPNWQRQSHNDRCKSVVKTHTMQTSKPWAAVRCVS